MKGVLREMIEIYEPNGIDWMGFELSRHDPYTFHHIKEKCNRGKCDINNGAILTKNGHRLLNILEKEISIYENPKGGYYYNQLNEKRKLAYKLYDYLLRNLTKTIFAIHLSL